MLVPRSLLVGALVALGLAPSASSGQGAAYTLCAPEGAVCRAPAGSLVRYGEPWGNRWSAERPMPESGAIGCNNATFGDPSPGTGKRCETRPGAAPPEPPPAEGAAVVRVSWSHATANTDGTALVDRTGYRVERATEEAGPWQLFATTAANATESTGRVPIGRSCFRVSTVAGARESAPSAPQCVTKSGPSVAPLPPSDVSAKLAELSLVTGTESGRRAVYARTSTGSRGPRLGDLAVGPVAQTEPPFDRVKCDARDAFAVGATRYSRVIDPRAPATLRGGYVSGCVSFGRQ